MQGALAGIAVAIACSLAACAAPSTGGNLTAALEPAKPGPIAATAAVPEPTVAALRDEAPTGTRLDSDVAQATLIAPTRPRPQIGQLIGMNTNEVTRLLGIPKLQRREPPAEVWQYASSSCVMFVFFYDGQAGKAQRSQSSSGDWRVSYVEARDRQDSRPLSPTDCLNGLFDRQPLALGEG
jgi:hypothetical protein